MQNGLIIEIAVINVLAGPMPEFGIVGIVGDHYWRKRWIEDGKEADQEYLFASLSEMAQDARSADEPVAWRYYETGVE